MKKLIILLLLLYPLVQLSAENNIYGIYDDQYSDVSVLRGWVEAGMPAGVSVGGGAGVSCLTPKFYAELSGGYSYNGFLKISDTPVLNASGEEAVESFGGMQSGLYAGAKVGYVVADNVKEKPFRWIFDYVSGNGYRFNEIDGPVHQKHVVGIGGKYLPTGTGWELLRRDDDVFWQSGHGSSLYLYPYYRFVKEYNFIYTVFELDEDERIVPDSIVSGVKDYTGHSSYEGGMLFSPDLMNLGGYFEYGIHSSYFRVCFGVGAILKLDAPRLSGYDFTGRLAYIFSDSSDYSETLSFPITMTIGFPLEFIVGGDDVEGEDDE